MICAYCNTCIGSLISGRKPIPVVQTHDGVNCHAVCWLWALAAAAETRALPQPRGRT